MAVTYNKHWKAPEWDYPEHEPRVLAEGYARLIKNVPGVLGLWADVRDSQLYLYTLIESLEDRSTGDEVFGAEATFFDEFGEPPVIFRVVTQPETIREILGDKQPLLAQIA